MYEKNDRIWVEAQFRQEADEDPIGKIDVHFSLPKEDQRDIAEIEKLATAKAKRIFGKMSKLMSDLAAH